MTRVRFLDSSGNVRAEIDAPPGQQLLKLGQNEGMPLEGTCEGQMACSTCHVLMTNFVGEAPADPTEEEEDMLDFAFGAARNSRLSCQLYTSETLELIEVRMPGGSVDMSR
ncbi:2Fe-2S iron-sulfur cluster binding domain-containing protein [Pacificimonas sp. WHA3]|uniref:2Fe-2S iron-sulfur cluster binding domain-containing protein n=1 Tax=Pacificimonas pallii TaxID=2827236 RepID=A0ABS6SG61_9SPHN|nr:2Fe-2S iron-sulfur cluster-binding protein [Pacificimonas pallii]MBV7256901.1 2Fe-2S iron-sulfur cluster binding domain-containing protein [Pacificimonas pallii]